MTRFHRPEGPARDNIDEAIEQLEREGLITITRHPHNPDLDVIEWTAKGREAQESCDS